MDIAGDYGALPGEVSAANQSDPALDLSTSGSRQILTQSEWIRLSAVKFSRNPCLGAQLGFFSIFASRYLHSRGLENSGLGAVGKEQEGVKEDLGNRVVYTQINKNLKNKCG